MGLESSSPLNRDARLAEMLLTCLEAADCGQAPDREELLARYPELADELADFLAGQDNVERLAAPLRAVSRVSRRGAGPVPETPLSVAAFAASAAWRISLATDSVKIGISTSTFSSAVIASNKRRKISGLPIAAFVTSVGFDVVPCLGSTSTSRDCVFGA